MTEILNFQNIESLSSWNQSNTSLLGNLNFSNNFIVEKAATELPLVQNKVLMETNNSGTASALHQPLNSFNDYSEHIDDDLNVESPSLELNLPLNCTTGEINTNSKTKVKKCRHCNFSTFDQFKFWQHIVIHLNPEKALFCAECPFATELKHHMDFHMRNHQGDKPFKCDKCSYECVNKSMLKSHSKSHSNIYQYKCQNCDYKTKYCHSLKIHLRKYQHNPDVVLDANGNPNPYSIIDIYGNRRGSISKSRQIEEQKILHHCTNVFTPDDLFLKNFLLLNNYFNSVITNQNYSTPEESIFETDKSDCNSSSYHNNNNTLLENNNKDNISGADHKKLNPFEQDHERRSNVKVDSSTIGKSKIIINKTPLNLSTSKEYLENNDTQEKKNSRRKGKACKLRRALFQEYLKNSNICEKIEPMDTNVIEFSATITKSKMNSEGKSYNDSFYCNFCKIIFSDKIMFTIHMGYHGYFDPFTCNRCGKKTNDKIGFYVHMINDAH